MWHCICFISNVRLFSFAHAAYELISANRGGMIAPLLGGTLLMIDRSFPVYTSVVIFAIAGICVLMLKEDAGDGGREPRERVAMH
jgi:hypothetical protein